MFDFLAVAGIGVDGTGRRDGAYGEGSCAKVVFERGDDTTAVASELGKRLVALASSPSTEKVGEPLC
jgi:hypothetical protein